MMVMGVLMLSSRLMPTPSYKNIMLANKHDGYGDPHAQISPHAHTFIPGIASSFFHTLHVIKYQTNLILIPITYTMFTYQSSNSILAQHLPIHLHLHTWYPTSALLRYLTMGNHIQEHYLLTYDTYPLAYVITSLGRGRVEGEGLHDKL